MPNVEWDRPHFLVTPLGTLALNSPSGYRYLIESDGYQIVPSLRVTQDNISQEDGAILHPRWKTGLCAIIKLVYHKTPGATGSDAVSVYSGAESEPACGEDLRIMHDTLMAHLDSIRQNVSDAQKLTWTPTSYSGNREMHNIQLLSWPVPAFDLNGTECGVQFTVESPFPYAVDSADETTSISNGGSSNIVQDGSASFNPVVKANGPFTGMSIYNMDDLDPDGNPLGVAYDGTRDGAVAVAGGKYILLNFFEGRATLFPDLVDVTAGLDPATTDFWKLRSFGRDNNILVAGCDVDVLWNNAWS